MGAKYRKVIPYDEVAVLHWVQHFVICLRPTDNILIFY